MKHHYFSPVTVVTLILFIVVSISTICTASRIQGENIQSHTNSTSTPLPGNPIRKAVLDALRQKMKRLHKIDMVFVVTYLKVKNGWCWVHTLPQSPDGTNHYEGISALLHQKNSIWSVVELACTEEENPECLSNPAYFLELKKRFPKVPEEILPKEQ